MRSFSTTTYTYDKNGNRVEVANEGGVHKYSYDRSGRLTQATYPDGRTEIIQDISAGNKVNGNKEGLREIIQTVLLGTYTEGEKNGIRQIILDATNGYTVTIAVYEYNSANQLTKVSYPVLDASHTLSYDNAGNMTSDGVKTYSYDSENRLVSIKEKTKTITFTYDDRGYRTSTSVNGKKSFYHYEGETVAYETDGDGNTTKKYSYDDKGRPISFTYSGATYYYITDGHGDIVGLTDASGVKVVSYTYDAFGNLSSIGGDKGLGRANPYRYAGYRYDDETSMYYLISRYYDPMLGRFISKDTEAIDPLEPVTLNLYTYAGNNPVNNVDPDGKAFWSFIKDKAKSFFNIKSIKPKTVVKAARAGTLFYKTILCSSNSTCGRSSYRCKGGKREEEANKVWQYQDKYKRARRKAKLYYEKERTGT